ncbi:Purine nucleoside receptor A [Aedoeadaptatus ivorii]|uniref:Purine nucleoside receptor A n=1 Tax=Aedoeadaptatus ivorii TaxID=54006 RepID=A0A448V0J0_9FIRM|nr:BMP family ABC transporter substrate-binding protein [Peptoniphilus ivorii]MDQ0509035.1 basic membrane protein A [Peptoniphilus ivorii]VEJ35117.1 Purine nucleoside receptor A [Peptoniphilus ivorii]
MKKKSLFLAMIMLFTFVLAACGGAEKAADNGNEGTNANKTEAEGKTDGDVKGMKIGFVTDEGGINDQSFNQGVWEGLQKANADFGFDVSYQESKEAGDYAPNIETLLDAGNEVIVAAGFNLGDAMLEAAENNPDVNFVIVDYTYEDGPDNLTGLEFKAEEPSFLVGYIAGLTSETNKVGFVGGQESTLIQTFEYGYKAGVDQAAKEKGQEIQFVSQYVGNFSDAAKGKSIATNMYQQGADVVFHASGGAGDGVIEAAKDQDKWAIGVDRDQNDIAPDNVLTSAMKRADSAVYKVLEGLSKGEDFPGGENLSFGLKDGDTVDIAPTSDKNVKPEILAKIDALKEKIVSGEIKVPSSKEEYETFEAK